MLQFVPLLLQEEFQIPFPSLEEFEKIIDDDIISNGNAIIGVYKHNYYDEGEYKFDSEYEFKTAYQNTYELFQSLPDPLRIYRVIGIKDLSDLKLDNLGSYWTWTENNINFLINNVMDYHSRNYIILLSALVEKKNINWQHTIDAYCRYSLDLFYDDRENEIFIDENKLHTLKDVYWEIITDNTETRGYKKL